VDIHLYTGCTTFGAAASGRRQPGIRLRCTVEEFGRLSPLLSAGHRHWPTVGGMACEHHGRRAAAL